MTPDPEAAPRGGFLTSFFAAGPTVPGYRIEGVLGAGGHSTVYSATDERGARVALKHYTPAFAPRRERLAREVAALEQARGHPGLAQLLRVAADDQDTPCLVMELVEGPTLADTIAIDGPLPSERLARLGRDLLAVLGHLRTHGVVHRDLKPANVVLRDGEAPVLVDFSVSRLERGEAEERLTHTGQAVGTRPYMAPEQCEGETGQVDGRTDLYGLGATLFHAATGVPPWSHESGWERTQRNPWRDPYPSHAARRTQVEAARARLPEAWGLLLASCLEGRSALRPDPERLDQAFRALAQSDTATALSLAAKASRGASYENHDHLGAPTPTHERKDSLMTPLRIVTALGLAVLLSAGLYLGLLTQPAEQPRVGSSGPLPTPNPTSPTLVPASPRPDPAKTSSAPTPSAPTPTPVPAASTAKPTSDLAPLRQAFDQAFQKRDPGALVSAFHRLHSVGRSAYPLAVQVLLRMKQSKEEWLQGVAFLAGKTIFAEPFVHWAFRTGDIGLADPELDRTFRRSLLVFLRGSPRAQLESLEAHIAAGRFAPKAELATVVSKVEEIDLPASSALLGRILEHPDLDAVGRRRVVDGIARQRNAVATRTLEAATRSRDAGLAERARLLLEARRARRTGSVVLAVEPGGEGARAGLRPGDLILKVDGEAIEERLDLFSNLFANRRHPPQGGAATLTILRSGALLTLRYAAAQRLQIEAQFVQGPAKR